MHLNSFKKIMHIISPHSPVIKLILLKPLNYIFNCEKSTMVNRQNF